MLLTLALFLDSMLLDVAQATQSDAEFSGRSINVMIVIGNFIFAAAAVMLAARRRPAITEEIYRDFVRKQEWDENLQRVHERVDQSNSSFHEQIAASLEKIDALRRDMSKGFSDVERSLGRIEGHFERRK